MKRFLFILCLALAALLLPAGAATVYTARGTWEAAAGGSPTLTEDFNSFTSNDFFPVDFGAFLGTASRENPETHVAVPPLNPEFNINGTPLLQIQLLDGVESIELTFDNPVTAMGFDLNPFGADVGATVLFSTNTGESGSYALPATDQVEFRGIVFDDAFESITFASATGYADHSWDNLAVYNTVPEPATGLMLTGGVLVLAGLLRNRRR